MGLQLPKVGLSPTSPTGLTPLATWLVAPRMGRQATQFKNPIPLLIRVAIGLRRLGKGDSFVSLSLPFGVGESTWHSISTEFEAVLAEKVPDFTKFPNDVVSVPSTIGELEER